jgi:3-oxoacyl-[acyl-carrier protein] reductase
MLMLLQNKNAVIYGAGGSLGGAIAKALANAGAKVFATGLHPASVQKLADDIITAGGQAEAAKVDALDEKAVNDHLQQVVAKAGTIDISYNAIDIQPLQDIDLVDMKLEDFVRPVNIGMTTHFITATAAGRIMIKQRSGVILTLTATPGGVAYPRVGGFGPACCAIEGFSRHLASELGPHGVRVVNMRSGGSPDSRVFKEAMEKIGEPAIAVIKKLADDTMLKHLPLMNEIAQVAVFLSSDMAAKITGTTIDITAGTSGINYRTDTVPFK